MGPMGRLYIYLHHFECVGMGKLNDSATTKLGCGITYVGPKQHDNTCCIVLLGAR